LLCQVMVHERRAFIWGDERHHLLQLCHYLFNSAYDCRLSPSTPLD
jgi:hypothetical protein